MLTKLRAAKIATDAGIETLVIGGGGAGLEALARGEVRGTRFRAKPHPPARKAWLAQQASKGRIEIDKGAANALQQGKSLLPKGITQVSGQFTFGDAVLVQHQGVTLAIGLSNYPSDALERIQGKHTREIAEVLGYKDYDEVIHRDNMVLLEHPLPSR